MDTSKIIKGVVSNGRYTVTAPIVKEDYGLYLKIEGVELPSTYEVDFSNSENNGTSVTMIGNADGVLIPHQFISTGKDVFAFLYWVGADYGKTVYKFRIPNKVRPDRTNEEPTPEEQSTIDQLIGAMNTAVAQTAQDVVDAEASAQAAGYDADRAEEARSASLDYAEQAEASAISAEQSATASANSASASANSASQSAQIKADVEELVDDAQASADASERSASNAYTYATSAERSSVNASSSAQSASGYASQAQSSANTASAKAQDASQSATTASQKATESTQSATNASQSAQTAEQAKTASQTAQGLAESARDSAISAKNDAESARDEAQSIVGGISGKTEQIDSNTERIESLEDDRYKPYPTDTASGAVASFPDGADDIPLKSLVVSIEPKQDGTGDPSPDNVRPISGWTGAKVARTGKNILGGLELYNAMKATFTNSTFDDANHTVTSTPSQASGKKIIDIRFKENTAYTIIVMFSNNTVTSAGNGCPNIAFRYTDGSNTSLSVPSYTVNQVVVAAFVSNPAKTLDMITGSWNTGTATIYCDNTGIFEGDVAVEDYSAYVGTIIPISWQSEAGTVYGGKLDVLSGKLTVYPYYASYNGETLTGEWISDRDVYAVGTTPTIGAQVVNIGAEGTEYQLTPHKVKSLLGANNIWADTGDTEVEYRADTKLYIERLTAPDSADMIADSNIVSGQYFMVGNSLYKATANIANGGQIIVGTNCTRVSLAQALNEINA